MITGYTSSAATEKAQFSLALEYVKLMWGGPRARDHAGYYAKCAKPRNMHEFRSESCDWLIPARTRYLVRRTG